MPLNHIYPACALLLTLLPGVTAAPPLQPRLICLQPCHNYGVRAAGETVNHEFVLMNEGGAPLLLTRIHGCCGATASLAANVVPPGSSTVARVSCRLAGPPGAHQKVVYVSSNDPAQPYCQLKFVGQLGAPPTLSPAKPSPTPPASAAVKAPLSVTPDELLLGPVAAGATVTRYLELRSLDQRAFRVLSVTPPAGIAAATASLSAGVWRITFTVRAFTAADQVVIHTDLPGASRVVVPLRLVTSHNSQLNKRFAYEMVQV